jgi:hypothetical protein
MERKNNEARDEEDAKSFHVEFQLDFFTRYMRLRVPTAVKIWIVIFWVMKLYM